jgi:hypothetical protein
MKPISIKMAALSLALLMTSSAASAQVQFPVSFDATAAGLTATEQQMITQHLQAAGASWLQLISIAGARSIEISVGINDARPTANASSVTSGFVSNEAGRNLFEQGVANELRTGVDPNGAAPDMVVSFNTNYLRNELWFDPNPSQRDAPVPMDRTDAMSVCIHEIGHALAYNGWADLNTGVAPATFWSTFDRWISPRATPTTYNYFDGPRALIAYGGRPDLTTGNIFHWTNSTAKQFFTHQEDGEPVSVDLKYAEMIKNGSPNRALIDEVMNGVVFFRGRRYQLSALDRAVLEDAGLPTRLFASGFE